MEIIRESTPIARKDHKCNFCGGIIPKGEKYMYAVLKYDDMYIWKNHFRCSKIASQLDMFDNCSDGLTGEDFQECIKDEYHNMESEMSDDNNDVDLGASTFKEMLDIVCERKLK